MSDEMRAALTLIVCDPYAGLDKSDTRCTHCGGEWAMATSFARHTEECPIQKVRRWLHTDEARHALSASAPATEAGERVCACGHPALAQPLPGGGICEDCGRA